ncbi:hypothetical protein AB0C69_33035 [Actinomadura sp. NPDC048032]|uniref:hypothetical protein n=1 Tax=Actinomadura sp. NPDC048032 TaxID=3155747 RepID=UPI0033E00BD4
MEHPPVTPVMALAVQVGPVGIRSGPVTTTGIAFGVVIARSAPFSPWRGIG